jgi:hypothetical protein
MSFLRHGEIYRSDGNGRDGRAAASLDRCDEFPNGYSSSGCSPAEPASASPSSFSFSGPVLRDNQFAANGNLSLFSLSQTGGPHQATKPPNSATAPRLGGFASLSSHPGAKFSEKAKARIHYAGEFRGFVACPQIRIGSCRLLRPVRVNGIPI